MVSEWERNGSRLGIAVVEFAFIECRVELGIAHIFTLIYG